jgi:replicative DNA helicase
MITKENECDETIQEKCLLALMLYNEDITKDTYTYIIDHVLVKMFFNKSCRTIYEIISNTYDTVEEGLLGTDLYRTKVTELYDVESEFKDIYAITELEEYWYPKTTYKHWIRKVQNTYYEEAIKEASSEEVFKEIIEEKNRLLSDTEMTAAYEGLTIIEDYEKTKGTSITTPWKSVNKAIGSIQGGDMIVLAGSTGCGKTCFMLNLAIEIAKQGKTVDIFSLEMPKNQLVQRIACNETGVDAKKFRSFSLTNTDIKKLQDYLNNDFKKLKINVYPKQKVSIAEIERIEKKSKSDIIFIDYLGLIEGDKRLGRYDRFSEISRTIKLMAMTVNKPVIALHQLNREFMQRENKEPQLSDLRESGQIEQDSDMVWFVYRPGMFDEKVSKLTMRFILAKNRHGDQSKIDLLMNGDNQKIIEGGSRSAKVYSISKTGNKEESFADDNNQNRETNSVTV